MNRYHFAAVLLATAACLNLHAQTETAYATIPFDFRIGNHSMPAGNYDVHQSGLMLTVHEESGRSNDILMTHAVYRRVAPAKSSLVFRRYGNEYFLANFWTVLSSEGLEIPMTALEKEIAGGADHAHEAVVAVRQK